MSENTIDLDFGTTAQKQQDGEKLPVVLLALDQGKYDMARSLDELRALADANGMEAVAEVTQKRSTPEAATLLGEGKVAEARLVCQNLNAAAAIFDGELTGSQIRNLSAALQVEVLDRTMLILEIFRARATTNEMTGTPFFWRARRVSPRRFSSSFRRPSSFSMRLRR